MRITSLITALLTAAVAVPVLASGPSYVQTRRDTFSTYTVQRSAPTAAPTYYVNPHSRTVKQDRARAKALAQEARQQLYLIQKRTNIATSRIVTNDRRPAERQVITYRVNTRIPEPVIVHSRVRTIYRPVLPEHNTVVRVYPTTPVYIAPPTYPVTTCVPTAHAPIYRDYRDYRGYRDDRDYWDYRYRDNDRFHRRWRDRDHHWGRHDEDDHDGGIGFHFQIRIGSH